MTVPNREIDRRMRRFEQVCRAHGLRITHQRAEIFRELARTEDHPDAEAVYKRLEPRISAMSLDTVYRTLAAMERLGLVARVSTAGGRGRFDANTDIHHHFVCTECGAVQDFYSQAIDAFEVPDTVKAMGTVTSRHIELRGVCSRCQDRKT